MRFYKKLAIPRLIDLAMRNSRLAGYRQETIGAARGFWSRPLLARLRLLGSSRRGTRLTGADSFPRILNPRRPRASRAFDVALPDSRASFSSLVSSMPYILRPSLVLWLKMAEAPRPPSHSARRFQQAHDHSWMKAGGVPDSGPRISCLPRPA